MFRPIGVLPRLNRIGFVGQVEQFDGLALRSGLENRLFIKHVSSLHNRHRCTRAEASLSGPRVSSHAIPEGCRLTCRCS